MIALLAGSVLLSLVLFSCASAPPAPSPLQLQIQGLNEEAGKAKPACDQYLAELEKIGVTTPVKNAAPDEMGEVFKNGSVAKAVLSQLEKHPGVPAATQEVMRLVHSHLEEMKTQTQAIREMDAGQPFCGMMKTYESLRKLVHGKKQYGLSKKEQERVRGVVFKWNEIESAYPSTLTSNLMQLALLRQLNDQRLLGKTERWRTRLDQLDQEARQLKKEIIERAKALGAYSIRSEKDLTPEMLAAYMDDLRPTDQFRLKLKAISEEIRASVK